MNINILLLGIITISTVCLVLLAKRYVKNIESQKGFWIKIFSFVFAILIPQFILQYLFVFGLNSKIYDSVMLSICIVYVGVLLTGVVNLLFWKLKNRKFMILFSIITYILLFIHSQVLNYITPFVIERKINKEYGTIIQNIEKIKENSGFYPDNISVNSEKFFFKYYYYKTFDDKKNYALYIANGEYLWNYCSYKNSINCFPDKWLFFKDNEKQWEKIPQNFLLKIHKENIGIGKYIIWHIVT